MTENKTTLREISAAMILLEESLEQIKALEYDELPLSLFEWLFIKDDDDEHIWDSNDRKRHFYHTLSIVFSTYYFKFLPEAMEKDYWEIKHKVNSKIYQIRSRFDNSLIPF
jgi:hypothetical protein